MKKILLTTISLSLFCISQAFALLEVQKISLDEALDIAIKSNPQLKIKALDTETAKNNIKTVSRLQNPNFESNFNIGETGKGEPQTLGLSYTFEVLKRNKRKQVAKSEYKYAQNRQNYNEIQFIYEVKKAYINFLHKKSNLKLLSEQAELTKELLVHIEKEANKGKIPKTDVVQAKIASNRAIMLYRVAKSEMISAQNKFNTVLNADQIDYDIKDDALTNEYSKLMTIEPEKEFYTFDEIKKYTLENRQDLKSYENLVEAKKNNLKVIKSKLIPDLEFSGGYGVKTRGMSETNHTISGAYAGVNITNIPLVYRYQPEIKNALIEIEQAELKYRDVKIDITRDVTDAWERYSIARDTLIFYNENLLPNSKELQQASRQSLLNNEIDLTSYLITKKVYLELILNYQQALADYYLSYAELLMEMGVGRDNIEKI